ncbi:hypothetical protein HAX54_011022 [Datura stramonium]|uniref:Uncharacterized protein n=1 Tax=Datura stramonium TaxID=4076 RepID=A0ABS8RWY7_DATST|nr:hypothetical protein [Datura stramonium]
MEPEVKFRHYCSSSTMKGRKREVLSLMEERRETKTKGEKRKGGSTASLRATLLVGGGDSYAAEVMVVRGSGGRREERKREGDGLAASMTRWRFRRSEERELVHQRSDVLAVV